MLNRRILRIKAFKALYSSVITSESSAPSTLTDAEQTLTLSLEAVRDLYILMLGVVSPLTAIAAERVRGAARKLNPIAPEANPDNRFATNSLAKLLDNDIDFQKIWKKKKFSWDQYDLILKKVWDSVREKPYYKAYAEAETTSLKAECKLFTKIFEEEFVELEELEQMLEDMSIYWNDDLAYALTFCCRTLNGIAAGKPWKMPPLYQSDLLAAEGKKVDSDKDFVFRLLREAYSIYPKYSDRISSMVPSFDKERLVTTDMAIMVSCLAEILAIASIPVKVSINEWVEIAKFYGTPKSSTFVNGIIDKLVSQLKAEGVVTKE
ncbi:MAG: transcription antitermination protein NusB [Bacteroidales bacterium]|nr:transcription antitermination protein NusB [Bacteroidales bacterium]